MLGTIHDKWDKNESVHVKEGEKFVTFRGKRLEVKIEENNKLRLTLVKTVNNLGEQHYEAVANLMNLMDNRRKDLAMIKRDLKEIFRKLADEDLNETEEEGLCLELRDKKAIKKNHEKEITKLEANTTVRVNYSIVKSGLTAVLPPGLILQVEFLPEPVCWCPHNIPSSQPVEETIPMNEELPLILAEHFSATGFGLEECFLHEEAKFVVATKNVQGQLCEVNGDYIVVESKEAEIKYSVLRKQMGMYEVSYIAATDIKECEQLSLAVTHFGRHIQESPFSLKTHRLLLEFSSSDSNDGDWLQAAIKTMSTISRAKLWVHLYDVNGLEVYKATGVTSGKWTKNHITSPGAQYYDNQHNNLIWLDNGDRMIIIGEHGIEKDKGVHADNKLWYKHAPYSSYNIIINMCNSWSWYQPRRMIIASPATAQYVPGWTSPENVISFSSSGFSQNVNGNWPKFMGTFRIYYRAL